MHNDLGLSRLALPLVTGASGGTVHWKSLLVLSAGGLEYEAPYRVCRPLDMFRRGGGESNRPHAPPRVPVSYLLTGLAEASGSFGSVVALLNTILSLIGPTQWSFGSSSLSKGLKSIPYPQACINTSELGLSRGCWVNLAWSSNTPGPSHKFG